MSPPLLELDQVHVAFRVAGGRFARRGHSHVHAVRGVSLALRSADAVALVGESGSGKTSLARLIVRLVEPTRGSVLLDGRDIATFRGNEERLFRRRVQMVFQNPYDSLNSRMKIGQIVGEGLDIHHLAAGRELERRVYEALDAVQLPRGVAAAYPRELSGGQRQRVAIARALILGPELLILDEPLSALDVSVQARIIALLNELRKDRGLAYLMISHDLAAVPEVCDRTAVMYLGQIMETGPTDQVIHAPVHPYTQALVSAVPLPDPDVERSRDRVILVGDLPSVLDPPSGCPFQTRCPVVEPVCSTDAPAMRSAKSGVDTACHLVAPHSEK